MPSPVDLEELERWIAIAKTEVIEVEEMLRSAQNRHRNLLNIQKLVLDLDGTPAVAADVAQGAPQPAAAGAHATHDGTARVVPTLGQSTRVSGRTIRRTPSTEMVAQLINESGREWTRSEAFEGFRERWGIPASWTTPANAFGNALARAVKRGLIGEADGIYMPAGGVGLGREAAGGDGEG